MEDSIINWAIAKNIMKEAACHKFECPLFAVEGETCTNCIGGLPVMELEQRKLTKLINLVKEAK